MSYFSVFSLQHCTDYYLPPYLENIFFLFQREINMWQRETEKSLHKNWKRKKEYRKKNKFIMWIVLDRLMD